MLVSSTAFENGGMIPQRHTGFGEDRSPELIITDAPENAASFAIILDDLDVPFRENFTHWIIWNVPVTGVIPEGLPFGPVIREPISACQGAAWGKHGYRGPKPPIFIRKEHRYVFTVYALDRRLDISENSRKNDLVDAMRGHILAEAKLLGTYQRDR